jgi:hypothetical protein
MSQSGLAWWRIKNIFSKTEAHRGSSFYLLSDNGTNEHAKYDSDSHEKEFIELRVVRHKSAMNGLVLSYLVGFFGFYCHCFAVNPFENRDTRREGMNYSLLMMMRLYEYENCARARGKLANLTFLFLDYPQPQ